MKELYKLLLSNDYMDNEEKVAINRTLMNAIHCELYPIEENGLYLRVTDPEDSEKTDITLWSNHEEDGIRSVKMITDNKEEILKALHKNYLEKKEVNEKKL